MMSPAKKTAIALASVPIVLWCLWLAFPASTIESVIEDSAGEYLLDVEIIGLEKGLFCNFRVEHIRISKSARELISLQNIEARIHPLLLFLMQLSVSYEGTVGNGTVSGDIFRAGREFRANLALKDADMRSIRLLGSFGIRGEGTVSGTFSTEGSEARADFVVKEAGFRPAEFSGVLVPLNFFSNIKGSLHIAGNMIKVESVSLEGRDIYARIKGVVNTGVADLTMELMPERSFLENPLISMNLDRYRVSPGYYVIPIRGHIAV